MTGNREVDADLVRPTGFDPDVGEKAIGTHLDHLDTGAGQFAGIVGRVDGAKR